MYRLLLVDDEIFVLQGLKRLIENLIREQQLPICEIRTAQNGLDAIECMKSYAADIVFTDIKMPGMDGMELIERLTAHNHGCKIIILSGFDNFEYAQRAIANNIKSYLLKPVTRAALEEAFLKVVHELTQEEDHSLYVQQLENQLAADLPLLREKFFYELSNGNYQSDLAEFLQLELNQRLHQVILISLDSLQTNDFSRVSLEKEKQLKLLQLANGLAEAFPQCIHSTAFQLHHRICCLISFEQEIGNVALEKYMKSYQDSLLAQRNITCSIGISNCFGHIRDFSVHLEEAYAALKQRMFSGCQSLVFYSDVFSWQRSTEKRFLYESSNKIKVDIYHALRAGQKEKVVKILNDCQTLLSQEKNPPLELVRTISSDLVTVFMMYAFEQNIDTEQLFYANQSPLEAVFSAYTLDGIFSVLHAIATKIFQCIAEKSAAETISMIQCIKKYVWNHISEDITLEALSDVVFLTPNYISTLFKKETGISFKDYVLDMKVQRAKELLQSDRFKIHEVAQAVGYQSSTYFSKVFKKVTGIYPSDYRNEVLSIQ